MERDSERGMGVETEREIPICCSTFQCILWLLLVCALTRDQTCNLGILR